MAYICNKPAGSCESCEHYRFDKEEQRMACFAQMAIDKVQIKTEIKTETIKIPLTNGSILQVEKSCNSDYPNEIYVGIVKDGVWVQDLVNIQQAYYYDEDGEKNDTNDVRVLVYGNPYSEDYTLDCLIPPYEEETEEEL